jgi:predicted phosphodiesterase
VFLKNDIWVIQFSLATSKQSFQIGSANCFACHASAKDPLYHYMPIGADASLWESELIVAQEPDFLFFGHTHLPMKSRFHNTLVVNPGSVGQPKDDDPRAAYAVLESREVSLRRVAYNIEETIRAYASVGLEPYIERGLCAVLRTGGHLPPNMIACQRIDDT